MKKFAKMSLVAAIAVAGMTSASAASLEEAIKGVDVSGQFRFRTEERSNEDTGTHTSWTDVEVEIGVKVPVNDNVTAVFKIDNAGNDSDNNDLDTIGIEDFYFSYVNGGLTVNAGQQNIPGRLTDGAQGNGVVALYNAGAFTVGAASFMDNNLAAAFSGKNINSVIAMGSVGPVSLLGQYADVDDIGDAYNLKADATFGPVTAGLEYAETDLDGNSDDLETFKAYVSGSIDIVSAKLSYAKTGDQGSGSLEANTDGYAAAAEAASESLLWQLGSATKAELDVWAIDASVAVTDAITLRAAYADGDYVDGTKEDVTEVLGQVSYKMSSNLNTYVRYSVLDDDHDGTGSQERGRIEVRYSF